VDESHAEGGYVANRVLVDVYPSSNSNSQTLTFASKPAAGSRVIAALFGSWEIQPDSIYIASAPTREITLDAAVNAWYSEDGGMGTVYSFISDGTETGIRIDFISAAAVSGVVWERDDCPLLLSTDATEGDSITSLDLEPEISPHGPGGLMVVMARADSGPSSGFTLSGAGLPSMTTHRAGVSSNGVGTITLKSGLPPAAGTYAWTASGFLTSSFLNGFLVVSYGTEPPPAASAVTVSPAAAHRATTW
jgi:hypothetical protein